jgi:hypothetical protein
MHYVGMGLRLELWLFEPFEAHPSTNFQDSKDNHSLVSLRYSTRKEKLSALATHLGIESLKE